MKALCITGADAASLEAVASKFYQAGLVPANTLQRDTDITFATWHKRVVNKLKAQKPIGRIWENIATDLIIANLDNDAWGWVDEQSVEALDFWADLETSIHFVLLITLPEEEIEKALEQGCNAQDLQPVLERWYHKQKPLLDFYLSHKDRCVLVSSNVIEQKNSALIQYVRDTWQMPLELSEFQVSDTTNQSSSSHELASLLLREVFKQGDDELIVFYQALLDAELRTSVKMPVKRVKRWLTERMTLDRTLNLVQDYQSLYQQVLAAKDVVQELEKSQRDSGNVKEENELLMLQLHQVQEELESTFLSKQHYENSAASLTDQLNTAKQKEKELTGQLNAAKQKEKELTGQLNTARQEVLTQLNDNKPDETALHEIKEENELLLLQLHQVQEELEHYFLEFQNQGKTLQSSQEEYSRLNNELTQYKRKNRQLKAAQQRYHEHAVKGQYSGSLPSLIEYDDIQLRHEQVNQDYEHLAIRLIKPEFEGRTTQEWTFRLSCAGLQPNSFGQYPKLEIPEQSDQLLDSWFIESQDDQGAKLELRFALPDAMDTAIWQKLAISDQRLLNALLVQLPEFLHQLQEEGITISRTWQDWLNMLSEMLRIMDSANG